MGFLRNNWSAVDSESLYSACSRDRVVVLLQVSFLIACVCFLLLTANHLSVTFVHRHFVMHDCDIHISLRVDKTEIVSVCLP